MSLIFFAKHAALPLLIYAVTSKVFFASRVVVAFMLMCLAFALDLDHIVANPIFDPNRCSIGFHPLHSTPFIYAYPLLFAFAFTRPIGAGIVIHLLLDGLDCI